MTTTNLDRFGPGSGWGVDDDTFDEGETMELTPTQLMFARRQQVIITMIDKADAAGDETERRKLIDGYQAANHVLQTEWGYDVVDEICRVACRDAGIPITW